MSKLKLYIQVPKQTEHGFRVVNLACDRMVTMCGLTPTEEILKTHFQAERVRMAIFERDNAENEGAKYIPQPLYIETEEEKFNSILEEIRKKEPNVGTLENITLSMGTLPCCIISKLKPEEYKTQEVENK